ncbi:MAG: hypothetical protein KAH20_01775 [Methylococcales bacterium]|nr:hypothetical protein [Methylococcales bacterium]
MYRNYQSVFSNIKNHQELTIQTAFHEAGHAASIYLGNKEKQLPPVFFQILITNPLNTDDQLYSAKVIDGQLIQHFPIVGIENIKDLSVEEQRGYQSAYEADVINLLVGPIAEAKYVAERDDELFSVNLLNVQALNYYGGSSDIKKAHAYLEFFISLEQEQNIKMRELFLQAFKFVENVENWNCIRGLAEYILNSKKEVISCEDAVEVFDRSLAA